MVSDALINLANTLQSSVPLISLFAYIPQWRKLLKNKSSQDISMRAWIIWSISSSFALFYSIIQLLQTGLGAALVFSCTVNLLFVVITLCMVINYRMANSGLRV